MTSHSDSRSDTISLTYQELAARLGIDLPSARRRVLRSKWPKTKGNDGKARVAVPLDILPPIPPVTVTDVPTDTATAVPPVVPTEPATTPPVVLTEEALSRLLSRVGDVAELRERLARAETRAELAEAARKAAEAERNALRAELTDWTSGNPLARMWRGLWYRRGR